ncbi:hypothetical protein ACFL4U_04030 [Candidatus Neomarinimicrobiota bacterium]
MSPKNLGYLVNLWECAMFKQTKGLVGVLVVGAVLLLGQKSSNSEVILFGIIYGDRNVIPFASASNGTWENPWTDWFWPEEGYLAPPAPSIELPEEWYVYSENKDIPLTKVKTVGLAQTKSHCETNWSISLDWKKVGISHTSEFAIASSSGLNEIPLDNSSKKLIYSALSTLGYTERRVEGESYHALSIISYFENNGQSIAIVLSQGYEGEGYIIIEVNEQGERLLLDAHGGGC